MPRPRERFTERINTNVSGILNYNRAFGHIDSQLLRLRTEQDRLWHLVNNYQAGWNRGRPHDARVRQFNDHIEHIAGLVFTLEQAEERIRALRYNGLGLSAQEAWNHVWASYNPETGFPSPTTSPEGSDSDEYHPSTPESGGGVRSLPASVINQSIRQPHYLHRYSQY